MRRYASRDDAGPMRVHVEAGVAEEADERDAHRWASSTANDGGAQSVMTIGAHAARAIS